MIPVERKNPVPIPTPKCGKCGAEMEEGYIPDSAQRGYEVPYWVSGKPVRGFFRGSFGLKVQEVQAHSIRTFRCLKCGYLESYALDES